MADADSRTGTTYISREVGEWLAQLHAPQDDGPRQAYDAPGVHGIPAIQVGQSEGKLLTLLMQLIGARRIVEVGTLAGYSTICLARALPADGQLWTIEVDEEHAQIAATNITAAGLGDVVTVLVGDAVQTLESLDTGGPVDAVFIDADKENYPAYGRWARDHVRPGGLLLGDNSALFGRLLSDDDRAAPMQQFHREAVQAFDTVNIPTPDGLLLGIRRDA